MSDSRPRMSTSATLARAPLLPLGVCILLSTLFIHSGLAAQPSPATCGSAEHRQFDFWIGNWEVYGANGKLAGTNRVEKILAGCVLQENWQSVQVGSTWSADLRRSAWSCAERWPATATERGYSTRSLSHLTKTAPSPSSGERLRTVARLGKTYSLGSIVVPRIENRSRSALRRSGVFAARLDPQQQDNPRGWAPVGGPSGARRCWSGSCARTPAAPCEALDLG